MTNETTSPLITDHDDCLFQIVTTTGTVLLTAGKVAEILKPSGNTPLRGPRRLELRGRPAFGGMCGPMWGGIDPESGKAILRYESPETYKALSL